MLKKSVIVLSIFIIISGLYSLYVSAESLCQAFSGRCYFDHQLYDGRCPNALPRQIRGLDAEMMCADNTGAIGTGASILDITGLEIEGVNCCLPAVQEEPVCGDGDVNQGSEECDGNDFNGKTCSDFNPKFNAGSLTCNNLCQIDSSNCKYQPQGINLALTVSSESLICPETGNKQVTITLKNLGENIDSLYIYDTIYFDVNCDGKDGRVYKNYRHKEFYCEDLVNGGRCINRYYASFDYIGCYYHNVIVSKEGINWGNILGG